jgi:hypothetical protein
MNGKSPIISTAPPFVLRLSKDERRVFQQNHNHISLLNDTGWRARLRKIALKSMADSESEWADLKFYS